MKNLNYIIIIFSTIYLFVIAYKILPYFKEETNREKNIMKRINNEDYPNRFLENEAYSKEFIKYINKNNVFIKNIQEYLIYNENFSVGLPFDEQSSNLPLDSIIESYNYYDGEILDSINIIIKKPETYAFGVDLGLIIQQKFIRKINKLQYKGYNQLSDIVLIDSITSFVEYNIGDTIDISATIPTSKRINSKLTSITTYISGEEHIGKFLLGSISSIEYMTLSKTINWERLFLYVSILIVINIFLYYILPKIGYIPISNNSDIYNLKKLNDYFEYDLKTCEQKTTAMLNRSTLMLLSGIIVATGGLIFFSFYLKDTAPTINQNGNLIWSQFLIDMLRPSLTLVFIEFIAIFLLRQYRNLIEDYKYFYTIYLIRFDNLIIHKILTNNSIKKPASNKLVDIINQRTNNLITIKSKSIKETENLPKTHNDILSSLSELTKIIKNKKIIF